MSTIKEQFEAFRYGIKLDASNSQYGKKGNVASVSKIELAAQYRILSELEEYFPKNSKHKAALFIDKKMKELLEKISKK